MEMPNSLTISGTGWNGIMKLPEITIIDLSELDTGSETFTSDIAIIIGSDTEELTFSTPVRLEFTGKGGNGDTGIGFFKRANSDQITLIEIECLADDLATVQAQLGSGGECIFDDGTDFIVWTTHATTFGHGHTSSTG